MNNNYKGTVSKKMGEISGCNIVLTNGENQFIGLRYDENITSAPYLVCKGRQGANKYQRKVIQAIGIPCVEEKSIVKNLYAELNEGDSIPVSYWSPISLLYSKLPAFREPKKEAKFEKHLRGDVKKTLYRFEENIYKKIIRKFKRQKISEKVFEGNVAKYFEEEIKNLTTKYELNIKNCHDPVLMTDEFYMEMYFEKFDIKYLQMIFVAEKERQIYIATRSFFMTFDFEQAEAAMEFVMLLVEICNTELKTDTQACCEEFDINAKVYEIAVNSIKALVEMNYKETGREYGMWHDTKMMYIYLKKDVVSEMDYPKMYRIGITYKQYLKNPAALKKILKEPRQKRKWNFSCHEKDYISLLFDKKFNKQTVYN